MAKTIHIKRQPIVDLANYLKSQTGHSNSAAAAEYLIVVGAQHLQSQGRLKVPAKFMPRLVEHAAVA